MRLSAKRTLGPKGEVRALGEVPSPREQEVLMYLVDGLSSPQIAHKMGISPRTVDMFKEKLRLRFHVHSVGALVAEAFYRGYADRGRVLKEAITNPPDTAPDAEVLTDSLAEEDQFPR